MLRFLIVLVMVLSPNLATAHWEDPQGCAATYQKIKGMEGDWKLLYDGVSEDGRDYIKRYQHDSGLINEEHLAILPRVQWAEKDTPEHTDQVLSEWLDWDGDGHYSEWYLFPRGQAACEDALHFVWSNQAQTYVLYATGRKRT